MFESLGAVAAIVVPVFALVGLGWLTVRTGILSEAVGDGLADFVFTIAIPALLFRTLATAVLPEVSPFPFWAAYFAGVAAVWIAADQIVRRLFGRDARTGVIAGVSAAFSNNLMVALPLSVLAFGEEGAVPLAVLVAIHLPVMMTAGTVLVTRAERKDDPAAAKVSPGKVMLSIARNLAFNPLIIGIAAGLVWRATGIPLEGIPRSIADMLTTAAVPCALFALGMSLRKYGLRGNVRPALIVSALKVLAMPALVWLFAAEIAHLPPLWTGVATLCAACPTGANAWLIANRFNTGLAISANTITLTTAVSVLTISLWLAAVS